MATQFLSQKKTCVQTIKMIQTRGTGQGIFEFMCVKKLRLFQVSLRFILLQQIINQNHKNINFKILQGYNYFATYYFAAFCSLIIEEVYIAWSKYLNIILCMKRNTTGIPCLVISNNTLPKIVRHGIPYLMLTFCPYHI